MHHSHTQPRDTFAKFEARITPEQRERIVFLRNILNRSTYEVAREVGVSHASVSRIARDAA